jgi:hypothetical protein
MKMKIKLTASGGYVVGDGKCPFDPDEFMLLFGNKIIEAQAAGLAELDLTEEQVQAITASRKVRYRDEIMGAPVRELEYTGKNVRGLLNEIVG